MKLQTRLLVVLFVSMFLGACASLSPSRYSDGEAMTTSPTLTAVVLHVRVVETQADGDGGAVAGAGAGGLLLSHVGGGAGRVVYTLAGMATGALVGQSAEQAGSRHRALEIVLRVPYRTYSEVVTVVQGDDVPITAGERVSLVFTRSGNFLTGQTTRTRVVPAV